MCACLQKFVDCTRPVHPIIRNDLEESGVAPYANSLHTQGDPTGRNELESFLKSVEVRHYLNALLGAITHFELILERHGELFEEGGLC